MKARLPTALLLSAAAAAQPGADDLLRQLASTEHGARAQLELLALGEPVVPQLADLLAHGMRGEAGEAQARAAAARVLLELGPRATGAVPALRTCITDPHIPVQPLLDAALVLARVAPFAGSARRELVEFLRGNPPRAGYAVRAELRAHWQQLVSSIALDAGAELDVLLAALTGSNPYALATACRALAHRAIGWRSQRSRIARALTEVVDHQFQPDEEWTWTVADERFAMTFTPQLVTWLRTEASLALAAFAPDSAACMLGQCQRLFALDPATRTEAAGWIGAARHPDAARWLLDAAEAAPADVAVAMLRATAAIGPTARFVAPRLAALEQHDDEDIAAAARLARLTVAPDRDVTAPAPSLQLYASGLPRRLDHTAEDERNRLLAWLDADGGRQRAALQDDERAIAAFHALPADAGGPRWIRWLPVRIAADPWRPRHWAPSHAATLGLVVDAAPAGSIGADRERLRPLPWVVELIATEAAAASFGDEDLGRLHKRPPNPRSFSFRPREAAEESLLRIKRAALARAGSLLLVVDGLVVSVQPMVDGLLPSWANAFTLSPAASDRLPALRSLALRQ